MKKGFTIVELLVVIGVIIVLMGIVTTAASQSMKASRSRRADALCKLVQAGFNAYYAQRGRWPGTVGDKIASGSLGTKGNDEGDEGESVSEKYVLDGNEVRECVKDLVLMTKEGTPVMDVSGLFVSRSDGEMSGSKVKPASGMDFMSAIHGTRKSREKMTTKDMYYGYPDPSTGYFLRFRIVYSIPTDAFSVGKQR